jgi:hypothetical protein
MGELEPNDSRNVTGTAVTPDGRWTGQAGRDPNLSAEQLQGQNGIAPQQSAQQDEQLRQSAHQQQQAAQGQQQGQQGQAGGQGSEQGFAEPFTQQEASQGARQQSGQQQAGELGQQSAPQQNMGGSQGEIGQANDGVSDASNQDNDHTSAIGQNQAAGAAGSGQASYGNSGQPQQFAGGLGQQGGGSPGAGQFADQLAKHQEVVDSNGQHVGTIDHVDGDRIKLTRKDSPDGEHHYISLSDVAGVEGDRVRLSGASGSGTQA